MYPMIVPIPYVHTGLGVLIVVVSIPLVLHMIPMNRFYGIRVREAFLSNRNWYRINFLGGLLILAFGLFMIGFSYFCGESAPPPTSIWAPVYLIVPLIAIFPVFVIIKVIARCLPDR
jgi:hypothetical protein